MKISRVLIVIVVLAIAAYFVMNSMKSGSAPAKAKPSWFSKLDVDGDGKLSSKELMVMDTNGDGKISAEEAMAYGIPEGDFNRMDTNADRYISEEELKSYGG